MKFGEGSVFMGVDNKRAESSTTILDNTKELVEKYKQISLKYRYLYEETAISICFWGTRRRIEAG